MKLEASPSASLSSPPRAMSTRTLALGLGLWATAAVAVAWNGALGRHFQAVPISLLGLVALGIAATSLIPNLRRAIAEIPTRALVAFHAVRLPIGAMFLVELSHGRLPATFALRGGYGDIVAGAGAIAIALAVRGERPRWALALWNVVGLLDILVVAGTANYLVFVARDATMLSAFSVFPYPVLPTFVVPLVILTHLEIFRRLRASGS